MLKPVKPLGRKAYGHIGHLPGSRITPADHHVHEGQKRICTEKARDKHDCIIVQEKLDGSCTAVAKLDDGSIVALGRVGYTAASSPYVMHHRFAEWVAKSEARFNDALLPGERLVGEWLDQAHGTRYALPHEPWVVFDLMTGEARSPMHELRRRVAGVFTMPRLIHVGAPLSIDSMLAVLEPSGHGAIDPVEGAVWRVQRKNEVDFLAKWVRPEKVDGCYLPDISKAAAVMNTWVTSSHEGLSTQPLSS